MDGSSAYLGMINQALLSTYYHLLENLLQAGFSWQEDSNGQPVNVKISWIDNEKQVVTRNEFTSVDKQVPLPIITIEDTGGSKVPFELGNAASTAFQNSTAATSAVAPSRSRTEPSTREISTTLPMTKLFGHEF